MNESWPWPQLNISLRQWSYGQPLQNHIILKVEIKFLTSHHWCLTFDWLASSFKLPDKWNPLHIRHNWKMWSLWTRSSDALTAKLSEGSKPPLFLSRTITLEITLPQHGLPVTINSFNHTGKAGKTTRRRGKTKVNGSC